ncbi:MAG TPA: MBL fold metallo-hydrolase [Gemmatimonadaceae bacterium]|nr:MBL fold metallo-hydrolase [Gemmatimonadaceae bacterium]
MKYPAAALIIVAATGCFRLTGPSSALRPIARDSTPTWRSCAELAPCESTVQFTYLGVGGFLIRAGDEAVITAPSFSHPALMAVATPFWPIHSDSEAVDRELHRYLGASLAPLAHVHAILIGHSHYDHLMDVPLVARHYLPDATIYGTLTTKRILMGDASMRAHASRIDSLFPADSVVASAWHVGRWIYLSNRRLRFMAVQSSHAPNWWFITMARCHAKHDRTSLPRTAWGWCLGEPVSYVIDLLDESAKPVFRIFYQDAATQPLDVVLPPFTGADQRPVDVAIVCAGNFKKVPDYPTLLLAALRPRHVILGHWEDFFHDQGDAPSPVRLTDTKELAARLDRLGAGRWVTLVPGGQVVAEY